MATERSAARLMIIEAAALLRRGETTPRALADECLARIERFEPRVRAWVLVDAAGARRQADRLGEELRADQDRGLLHGIPIGIKDIVDVAGLPTRAGSPLRERHVASADAPIVAGLRDAGAVFLGKTVTTQFASFDPPPTRNPWNLQRTPAGSSSGSAAAVALGMCLGAVGSQTGGSITRPASFCGVAGCKPAYGALSLEGIVPLSPPLDHPGPLCGDVAGCAAMFEAMSGQRPRNTISAAKHPPRLGVPAPFFEQTASPEVWRTIEAALRQLANAGAVIDRIALPPSFDEALVMHHRIMARGAAETHRETFPAQRDQYGPKIASLIDQGLALSTLEFEDALRHQERFRNEINSVAEKFDALVTPGAVTTAVGLDSTGDPRFNAPWSHAGVPTVCFPCGLASDGLPVSLQLIGSLAGLNSLLSVAAWCEDVLKFRALPPLLTEA